MSNIKKELYPVVKEYEKIIDNIDISEFDNYEFSENYQKKKEALIIQGNKLAVQD